MAKVSKAIAFPHDNAEGTATANRMNTIAAAVTAMLLGVFIVYGAGFAGASVLHNAAHDGRHSFSFPCH